MNRTFITGDTHGNYDLFKLEVFNRKMKDDLDKSDVVIISGDCGFIWYYEKNKAEIFLKETINNFSFSVFNILGNHENYDRIEKLPTKIAYGNEVWYEPDYPNIVYAKHGNIYEINGKYYWTMNGGYSIDKFRRTPGLSWWEQEIPTEEQLQHGLNNYTSNKDKIDVIVTHTCPYSLEPLDRSPFKMEQYGVDKTIEKYLENIYSNLDGNTKEWYCGHWHIDEKRQNIQFLYQDILEID